MVMMVLAGQLVVLLVGFALLESWLAQSVRQAVAQRSYESQMGTAQLLAGEFTRLGVTDLAEGSDDWQRAMDLVASWHPENGWRVSVVDLETGQVLLDPRQDLVGKVLPEMNSVIGTAHHPDDVLMPITVEGNWVVSSQLPGMKAALLVHAPVAAAVERTQRFLTTFRAVGLLIVFGIAGFSTVVTGQLMRRYESRLTAINASLENKVVKRTQQLEKNRDAVIYAVAKVAEARDEGTGQHLERIACYTGILADELVKRRPELGPNWSKVVSTTSILHDIGKVGIPDEVLLKPGKLTDDERTIIQKHAYIGGDTLQAIRMQWGRDDFLDTAREIVLGHHEQWDGGGYPLGVSGTDIPLSARIVAVADVYDALTSVRPYKKAMPHEEASGRLRAGAGTHFDPDLIDVFEAVSVQMDKARGRLQDAFNQV